jgi:1-acyl-sn-glycerol-3-phosphate acyltransferase
MKNKGAASKYELLEASFDGLEKEIQTQISNDDQRSKVDNKWRRSFYSDIELLRLDFIELSESENNTKVSMDAMEGVFGRMDKLIKLLKLVPVKRTRKWWAPLEVIVRFLGVSCSIMLVGMFCSLPLLLMRAIDQLLQVDPFRYTSEYFKRGIAWFFLFQSGIQTKVEGLNLEDFRTSNCVLLTFSHASNIDGFLVSGTCPIRQLAFGKKELFMVPFFSWISLAFGGVPVDRGNRDRAVKALKRSTDAAKVEKLCIAIAPEGTRSMTGHLLPFKKGKLVAFWVLNFSMSMDGS